MEANVDSLIKNLLFEKEPFNSIAYTQLKLKNKSDLDIIARAIELGYIKRTPGAKRKKRTQAI